MKNMNKAKVADEIPNKGFFNVEKKKCVILVIGGFI